MTAVLSEFYLMHEWIFWPLFAMRIVRNLVRGAYEILLWFPRTILELLAQKPSMIIEIVAMLSAILFAVWTSGSQEVGVKWKVISSVLGGCHLIVLMLGSWEGRVKVMIVSTVFWWCLTFAFLPRRLVFGHVFLIPLCWAYAVTTLALLRHCDDRGN